MEVTITAFVLLWYLGKHYRKEVHRKRYLARRKRLEARLAHITATPAFDISLPFPKQTRPAGGEIIDFPRRLA
ncbi:MAG TPA: hypothetical protein GX701_10165 [Clostridiales bacterium]|nr:hypothetical protein [Clostridiales bacterium]